MDVANLRATLGEREAELDQVKARASLLSVELAQRTEQLNSVLQSRAWRLTAPLRAVARLRPRSQRDARQMKMDSQLIAQSGLFDVEWYLSQNPDVATHGADPIVHYLQQGALQGEIPAGLSAVNGTLTRILMCERLDLTLWFTICASGLSKVADHLRLAELRS